MACLGETLIHFDIRNGIFHGRTDCQTCCSEPARQTRSTETWATQSWIWAFLFLLPFYRAQEALREGLRLLFPARQGVGIATHRTEEGRMWGEPRQNCPRTWLGGVLELDIPVLCSALLQPLLSTRPTREIKWRSYLPRGATRIDARRSQCLSKKTAQNIA